MYERYARAPIAACRVYKIDQRGRQKTPTVCTLVRECEVILHLHLDYRRISCVLVFVAEEPALLVYDEAQIFRGSNFRR